MNEHEVWEAFGLFLWWMSIGPVISPDVASAEVDAATFWFRIAQRGEVSS